MPNPIGRIDALLRGRATAPSETEAEGPTRAAVLFYLAAILVLSQVLLLAGIDQPAKLYFDEVHYIPAARALLAHQPPINLEHPPLAKWLMAQSMAVFGDDPLGWRYPSVLFGSLSLAGMYLWALALFRDNRAALWATAATFLDQMLYVQARIAMLDIFALAFSLWGLAAFTATWMRAPPLRTPRLFLLAGVFLGLSAACKWSGLLPLGVMIGVVAVVKLFQRWRVSFAAPSPEDWFRPDLWRDMTGWDWTLGLVLAPLLAYYLSFACLGFDALAPLNFIAAQGRIFGDNSTLAGTHPYMSGWQEWPLLHRGVWYFFEGAKWDTPAASAQAILFLGNPLVMWGGLAAMAACLFGWIADRRREAFIILTFFGGLWLAWAVVPRHLTFAFYYLPSATVLSLALAYVFYRTRLDQWPWARRLALLAALAMFLYFLPVSNAAVPVSEPGFNASMWLKSWR